MVDTLLEKIVRYPRHSAVIAIVVLVLAAGFGWWNFVWQSPQRVFEDMLAGNLATTSVTKHAAASGNGQSIDQYSRLQMGGANAAAWLVTATQGSSSVTTESIGTPAAGYIRYTHLAAATQPHGSDHVLDVWAKGDSKTDSSLGQLFSGTLLDISNAPLPPIANLPENEQQSLLTYMRDEKIFTPSYTNVKRETVDGRGVYTYAVAVQLGAYIRLMQAFAHYLGLTGLDTIDPSQYSTVPAIALTMSVDRASHQLVRVTYPQNGFAQHYTDWGLSTPVAVPSKAISTTALQNRVQALVPHAP